MFSEQTKAHGGTALCLPLGPAAHIYCSSAVNSKKAWQGMALGRESCGHPGRNGNGTDPEAARVGAQPGHASPPPQMEKRIASAAPCAGSKGRWCRETTAGASCVGSCRWRTPVLGGGSPGGQQSPPPQGNANACWASNWRATARRREGWRGKGLSPAGFAAWLCPVVSHLPTGCFLRSQQRRGG